MNALTRYFRPLFDARVWTDTSTLLLALPLGVVWFTTVVTLISTSAALMITLAGVPLLAATVLVGRWISSAERARVLPSRFAATPAVSATVTPPPGSWWARLRELLRDRSGWRGVGYAVLALPLGIIWFTATVVPRLVSAMARADRRIVAAVLSPSSGA